MDSLPFIKDLIYELGNKVYFIPLIGAGIIISIIIYIQCYFKWGQGLKDQEIITKWLWIKNITCIGLSYLIFPYVFSYIVALLSFIIPILDNSSFVGILNPVILFIIAIMMATVVSNWIKNYWKRMYNADVGFWLITIFMLAVILSSYEIIWLVYYLFIHRIVFIEFFINIYYFINYYFNIYIHFISYIFSCIFICTNYLIYFSHFFSRLFIYFYSFINIHTNSLTTNHIQLPLYFHSVSKYTFNQLLMYLQLYIPSVIQYYPVLSMISIITFIVCILILLFKKICYPYNCIFDNSSSQNTNFQSSFQLNQSISVRISHHENQLINIEISFPQNQSKQPIQLKINPHHFQSSRNNKQKRKKRNNNYNKNNKFKKNPQQTTAVNHYGKQAVNQHGKITVSQPSKWRQASNQLDNQLINPSIKQPISSQPFNLSANPSFNQSSNQSFNPSFNQSFNPSFNPSTNPAFNPLFNQSDDQPNCQPIV